MLLLLCVTLIAFTGAARAGDARPREYEVKAAMVCNFAQFVDWPRDAFESDSADIVIVVAGSNPFGSVLDQVAASKKVGGRSIVVRYAGSADKIAPCHLLFIPASEEANIPTIMAKVANGAVLTLGESDSFPWAGGIIRFYTAEGKVRFEVNVKAAETARLKISSKLLKLARIFDRG